MHEAMFASSYTNMCQNTNMKLIIAKKCFVGSHK